MTTVIYDGSYEGLLTALFEIYEYRFTDAAIARAVVANHNLFGTEHIVNSNTEKAVRVMRKLTEKLSPHAVRQFYKSYLSELTGIENHLLGYLRYMLSSSKLIEHDYGHPDVLMIQQTSRKVDREKHRMEAFVRFQLAKDNLYYSIIQPDFDVLPLIKKHFKDRYADQRWLIFDSRRKYGIYYDMDTVQEIEMDFHVDPADQGLLVSLVNEKEPLYQLLWQQYYNSVNIPARKNLKLHIRHVPKRYWNHLVEKKG